MSDEQPVCLVMGAGAGIGGHVGARFAQEGYHSVLVRRSDKAGLDKLVDQIKSDGGAASGFLLDASEDDAIENMVASVEKNIGPIEVVVFNLGAQIGNRDLADTSLKAFELGWRLACFSLFRLAKAVSAAMVARGRGTFLVTSSTAAMRGNRGQHSHAAAMGGRRMLCQSLNAELAPQNIHVCHIIIDGAVEAPDTLGKLLGAEVYEKLLQARGHGKDQLLIPAHLAEVYLNIAQQHRSVWTHEMDLRPFAEQPWWNS